MQTEMGRFHHIAPPLATPSAVLFFALVVATVIASMPALSGDWIYDDFKMLNNPSLDGVEDIPLAFGRVSADYLNQRSSGEGGAVTYRPLSMISLLIPFLLPFPSQIVSHLISLCLHLLIAGLILWFDFRRFGRLTTVGATVSIVYSLHPTFAEAWLWINGRSDILAGVFVIIVAGLLMPRRSDDAAIRFGPLRLMAICAATVMALLSKETALPVICAMGLAAVLPSRCNNTWEWKSAGVAAVSVMTTIGVAMAVYFTLRHMASGDHLSVPSLLPALKRWPLLAATGVETMLAPFPRPMRMLAYEYWIGWTPSRIAAISLLSGAMGFLAVTGRLRLLLLLLGGVGSLLPCGYIVDYYWQGFDRYLLFPGLMAAVAFMWRKDGGDGNFLRPCGAVLAIVAIVGCISLRYQAEVYSSQRAFVAASLNLDRDSGIGQMWVLRLEILMNRQDRIAPTLRELEKLDLPAPMLRNAAAIALEAGQWEFAERFLESALQRSPDFPGSRRDILIVRAWRGRWDDVEKTARQLMSEPLSCEDTKKELQKVLSMFPLPDDRVDTFASLTSDSACKRSSGSVRQ